MAACPLQEDGEKERIEKSSKEGNCFYLIELQPTFIQLWFEKCPLYSVPREIRNFFSQKKICFLRGYIHIYLYLHVLFKTVYFFLLNVLFLINKSLLLGACGHIALLRLPGHWGEEKKQQDNTTVSYDYSNISSIDTLMLTARAGYTEQQPYNSQGDKAQHSTEIAAIRSQRVFAKAQNGAWMYQQNQIQDTSMAPIVLSESGSPWGGYVKTFLLLSLLPGYAAC